MSEPSSLESPALHSDMRADHAFMGVAMQLAAQASSAGEVPVGAIVVSEGQIIAEGSSDVILANQKVREVYLGHQFRI